MSYTIVFDVDHPMFLDGQMLINHHILIVRIPEQEKFIIVHDEAIHENMTSEDANAILQDNLRDFV